MNAPKRTPKQPTIKNSPEEMRDTIVSALKGYEQVLPYLDGIDTSPITRQLAALASRLNSGVQLVQGVPKLHS